MGTKLIENVDNEIWRRFTAYCKAEGKLSGEMLTKILKDYLKIN